MSFEDKGDDSKISNSINQRQLTLEGQQLTVIESSLAVPDISVIDFTRFEGIDSNKFLNLKELFKDFVKDVEDWLKSPVIIDSFGEDHTARRKWRDEILRTKDDASIAFIESNKLKSNRYQAMESNISTIKDLIGMKAIQLSYSLQSKLLKIRDFAFSGVQDHNTQTIEKKIEIVKQMETLLLEFLKELIAENQETRPDTKTI